MEDQQNEEEIPKEEQKQEENKEEPKIEENKEEEKKEEKAQENNEAKKEDIQINDVPENKIQIEDNKEEKQKIEKEKIEKERLEKERIEKERIEKERLEKERLEKERIEKERLEKERLKKEKSKKTFEKCLWNKYEYLHKRYKIKVESFENIIDIFTRIMNSLKDHNKVISALINKNYNLFPGTDYTQTAALNMLKKGLDFEFNQLNSTLELLKKTLIDQLKKHKDEVKAREKDFYNQFIKVMNKYNDSKVALEKNKNKYHQSLKVAENALRNSKSLKVKNIDNSSDSRATIQKLEDKARELLNEAKKNYDKYIASLNDTNRNREESIDKQLNLIKLYQSLEEKDGELITNLLKEIYNKKQEQNKKSNEYLIEFGKAINSIDIQKDNLYLLTAYNSNEKPDEAIKFVQYEPNIDFENAPSPEEYKINHEIIVAMKSVFPEIMPGFNTEEENQKQEMRELSKKIFITNIPFTNEEKTKLMKYLTQKSSQNYFLIYLSKQRTKGRFCRSQKLVKELAEILNIILKTAEQEKDYHAAKNCMILSQTYYFEEKENKTGNIKKNYLINYIINHKWLRSPDFWRGIIQEMIDSEAKNYMKLNPDEPSIFDKNNKKSQAKMSNICFSQLLPYANNMKEFYMDMRMILKIIDEFVEKYNIKKEIADTIYKGLISDKSEEIEKMRKEYKENPNFENELMSVEEVKKQREGK